MNDLPDIFHSPVISHVWDAFWEDLPAGTVPDPCYTVLISLPFLPNSPEAMQLAKMMEACQCPPDHYRVIQVQANQQAAWHKIRAAWQPKYIILLGIQPAQLGILVSLMPYQVNRFNGCCWIPTLSLEGLAASADIKKHTWNYGLKPVFIDKAYG
jgi:hypothetical protein